jgi:hypothetical protein
MTQKEFIKVLNRENYSYEIEGDKIIVTSKGYVYLNSLTSLPPGVEFRNGEGVYLRSLTSLPPGVEFRNGEYVELRALTSLPPGVEFKNGGDVLLRDLIGGWFNNWKGNIEGIDSKMLLNKMIKDGMFI